ncbi:hypothetical protein CHS0354_021653 [Potamilus streckersoni]|uniref:CMP-sialic acid transporter n=1 Tax=Potamilus streckersoni TaxID=2493646 RepID=A0AAE0W087_9BIVA|nr:hypothetical protein CHS0354_021653 [Potamilus streckersoni]
MTSWCSEDFFPTKLSFVYFVAYMGLFINQGILVTASKTKNNAYQYNTVTVVLLTECLKLIAAILIYLRGNSVSSLISEVFKNRKVLLYYFVPAGLYCLYNNLQFVNLGAYDPTTYFLLLQFRVVVTGVVFQIIFQKKLSCIQWLSLIILTIGCIVKEYGHDASRSSSMTIAGGSGSQVFSYLDPHLFLIMLQVFSSCFAGVYNEYLLKDKGCDIHIMVQNVFMYVDSIICNVVVLSLRGQLTSAFTQTSLETIFQIGVIAIMVNNAAIGIVVSLFLRSLNSILKTFASALELMFTAVLCYFIFGISIDVYTVFAIFIVSGAVFLYAQNPVVNKPKNEIASASGKGPENSVQKV